MYASICKTDQDFLDLHVSFANIRMGYGSNICHATCNVWFRMPGVTPIYLYIQRLATRQQQDLSQTSDL